MTPDQPDDLDPRAPTRPRGHTLQDRLRRSAEQRVQHQARAHGGGEGGAGDELAALLDLLNNGPSVPPRPAAPEAAPAAPAPVPAAPAPVPPIVAPTPAPPPVPAAPMAVPPPTPPPERPLTAEIVPPPLAADAGTFTRETFTRETFIPAPRADGPSAFEQQPETWDVAAAPAAPIAPLAPSTAPASPVVPTPVAPPWDVRSHEAPVEHVVPAAVPLPPAPPGPPAPPPPPASPGAWAPDPELDPEDDDLDDLHDDDGGLEPEGPGTDVVLAPVAVPAVVPPSPGLRTRRRMKRDLRQAKRETRMAKRRYRILPRTVIGLTAMLLVAAIAAGASGAVLYAYYDWRLTQNEDRVGDLAEGLETRLSDANVAVENATNEAVSDVRAEGDALRELINDQNLIADLQPRIAASVWYVSTLDDAGRSSVGSAFVVAGDGDGSLLLTSYTSVASSTVDPAPEITLRKGDETMVATLYAWDPARDLALLTVDRPDMEPLVWANEEERAAAAGKRGFVVSGLGGADATFSPGQVLDLTATGIQHNVAISEQFQGGPLLNADGKVLAVASMEYNPLNFESTGSVSFAVPVGLACEQVLTCNGDASGAG